jgi:hypothetical protein
MAVRLLVANGKDGGWRLHPALVAGGVYGRRSDRVKINAIDDILREKPLK